ncbi:hypothetical protein GQ42DRAFT_3777 [Ramicandelaber brevisporus]|nr:hypothetical protein GQ42DRAFT_3777 [Ramicandelaber brevisporus]
MEETDVLWRRKSKRHRLHGAMVARSPPERKAGCSSHSGVIFLFALHPPHLCFACRAASRWLFLLAVAPSRAAVASKGTRRRIAAIAAMPAMPVMRRRFCFKSAVVECGL